MQSRKQHGAWSGCIWCNTSICRHTSHAKMQLLHVFQAYADIKGVSYDAAKIKMMEILVKVESGIERENKMKAKFGEEFVKAFADFLKTMREKNDKTED